MHPLYFSVSFLPFFPIFLPTASSFINSCSLFVVHTWTSGSHRQVTFMAWSVWQYWEQCLVHGKQSTQEIHVEWMNECIDNVFLLNTHIPCCSLAEKNWRLLPSWTRSLANLGLWCGDYRLCQHSLGSDPPILKWNRKVCPFWEVRSWVPIISVPGSAGGST